MDKPPNGPSRGTAFSRLVQGFEEHGSRLYEAEETYRLWIAEDVECLLRRSPHFGYSRQQARSASGVIAFAAEKAANKKWIGHPDDDPYDAAEALAELRAGIRAILAAP